MKDGLPLGKILATPLMPFNSMHVSTCTPRFYILGTAELILLNLLHEQTPI